MARMTPCMAGLSITYHESRRTDTDRTRKTGTDRERRDSIVKNGRNFHKVRFKGNCMSTGVITGAVSYLHAPDSITCTLHAGHLKIPKLVTPNP